MAGWVTLWLGGIALAGVGLTCAALWLIEPRWIAILFALLALTPLVAYAGAIITSRWSRTARALADGLGSLKDRDFSVSVTRATADEMGDLVTAYNGIGDKLRVERQSLYQRELMLDTVIQSTPLALVLTNDADAVLYSNSAARELFAEGRKLEGDRFVRYLERAPAPLREAIERGGDTLFTLELAGEPRGLSRFAAPLPAERPAAPAAVAQAAHARDQFAGSGHVEEGDPGDRARAEQFPRADLLARSFGADPRACAARPRAAGPRSSPPSKTARGTSRDSSRATRSSPSCRSRASRRWPGTCCSNGCAWSWPSRSWARCRSAPRASTRRRSSRR